MQRQFRTFAPTKRSKMVIQLIIVWALGVVAFFSLWAILTKVIKRISEKKTGQKEASDQDENRNQGLTMDQ